jgi:hypothetical protein
MRQWLMMATLIGALAGCATAAQRQSQNIRTTVDVTVAQGNVCYGQINADAAYAELTRHFPFQDIHQATLAQQIDPTFATPHEVALISERHDRIVPCRKGVVDGFMTVEPSIGVLWAEAFSKGDENLLQLAKGKESWGDYVVRAKAIADENIAKRLTASREIDAGLNASHQQEMAGRAAAAQAFSNSMAQQQMINQNQQMLNNANRPVTTNCNRFGNSVNCTSY